MLHRCLISFMFSIESGNLLWKLNGKNMLISLKIRTRYISISGKNHLLFCFSCRKRQRVRGRKRKERQKMKECDRWWCHLWGEAAQFIYFYYTALKMLNPFCGCISGAKSLAGNCGDDPTSPLLQCGSLFISNPASRVSSARLSSSASAGWDSRDVRPDMPAVWWAQYLWWEALEWKCVLIGANTAVAHDGHVWEPVQFRTKQNPMLLLNVITVSVNIIWSFF